MALRNSCDGDLYSGNACCKEAGNVFCSQVVLDMKHQEKVVCLGSTSQIFRIYAYLGLLRHF